MIRADFIPKRQMAKALPHSWHAFLASCLFHGGVLGLLLGLSFLSQAKLRMQISGSPAAPPTISLSTLVMVPCPSVTVTKPLPAVCPAPPAQPVATLSQPHTPSKPAPVEKGVPLLALQSASPAMPKALQENNPAHLAISHTPAVAQAPPTQRGPTSAPSASGFAPGPNVWPHPDYPSEARDLHETGTVIVNVAFDAHGGVEQTEVTQSSGVQILDSHTRAFIRARWHSLAYAGQTVSVPVQYTLEDF